MVDDKSLLVATLKCMHKLSSVCNLRANGVEDVKYDLLFHSSPFILMLMVNSF